MKRILVAALLLGACGDGGPAEPPAANVVEATTSIEPASSSSVVVPSFAPTTTLVPSELDTEWFDQTVMADTIGLGAIDVQAAVVRDGRVVHQTQFSAPSSPAPVTSKSRFRIASISKILTAVTVMQLVEDGVVTLDDRPLAEVAGRLGITLGDSRLTDVTVLQLLSHTSGLASGRDLYFDSPQLDADGVLAAALTAPLASEPGEQFTYSNTNYVILGRLVGWRTGTSWDGAARQMVLDPLGLADWQVGRTSSNDEGDAQYAAEPGRNYMELLEAAGAWTASAADVALLVDALGRGQLFDLPATKLKMLQPSSAGPPDEDWTYGLGVRIFAGGVWGHSGTLENTHDMVLWFPDGTVVVVLVNGEEPSDSDRLIDTIRRALSPESPADSTPFTSVAG